MRLRSSVTGCLLLAALTGCGYESAGQPDECPPNAACAAPPQPTPSGRSESPLAASGESADTSQVLAVVGAPDGSDTLPVPTTYLGPGSSETQILVRVEYPDLCQELLGAHVIESEDVVTVVGVASAVGEGPCPLRLLIGTYAVPLSAPLGMRTVSVA